MFLRKLPLWMLSLNVCHLHFQVNFQVIAVNPEWQCSVLYKVGTGSETAKGIFRTVCDAYWHVWNFLLHFLRKPRWVSLSFAKNFSIFSHVLYHSNWSKTREVLSKFCTFFSSSVMACFLFGGGIFLGCFLRFCLFVRFLFWFVFFFLRGEVVFFGFVGFFQKNHWQMQRQLNFSSWTVYTTAKLSEV